MDDLYCIPSSYQQARFDAGQSIVRSNRHDQGADHCDRDCQHEQIQERQSFPLSRLDR